jgi:Na+:H+ antiporter, NhaA family
VAHMAERFRLAMAANDVQTAKNILGGFEELVVRTESPSERLTRKLNDWVAFLVLPLFALSNAGVTFSRDAWGGLLTSRITWGVLLGLVLGKPLGIVGCSFLAVKLGVAQLPSAATWRQIAAVGILGGIGFTVAIFISSVAFDDPVRLLQAKTGVLAASVVCAVVGYFSLRSESI